MFGQTFEAPDLVTILMLIVLEGVLSIDNALVLGVLAKRLPKHQQGRALTYGLIGAFVFRLVAIATAAYLIRLRIVQLLGGAYLVYIAVNHFVSHRGESQERHLAVGPDGHPILLDDPPVTTSSDAIPDNETSGRVATVVAPPNARSATVRAVAKFWPTVIVIELTDIAFAIDSILAAVGLAGQRAEKLWVVFTGGMLGVILMRFAAVIFIKLLEKFPRFETSAYLLVVVIGFKLVVDWAANTKENPHRVNFHDLTHVEFWIFWILMLACFGLGFMPKRQPQPQRV